jgi:hypothetical protein
MSAPLKHSVRWQTLTMEVDEYLRLKVDPSSDGTGKLTATIAAGGFAASGEAYFNLRSLAEFSQQLRAFPLSESDPPHIEGGFWSKEKRGVIEQVHLSIRAYQIGSKRQIGVRVTCADPPLWPNDRKESQNSATIELMSSYAALERFAKEVDLILESKLEEAVLSGERLA